MRLLTSSFWIADERGLRTVPSERKRALWAVWGNLVGSATTSVERLFRYSGSTPPMGLGGADDRPTAKLLIGLLVASLIWTGRDTPAHAVDAQVHTDWAYYVRTTNSGTLNTLGCNWANNDLYYGWSSLIILDFGGQTGDGSTSQLTGGGGVTNYQIRDLTQNFAAGYANCRGPSLELAIGTNNSIPPAYGQTYGGYGTAWANTVVAAVKSWMANQCAGIPSNPSWCNITVVGANDMESWVGLGGGTGAHPSNDWAQKYSDANVARYYDFGSLDGCPWNRWDNVVGCSGGWAQADYQWVSWRAPAAYATPIIYYYPNELQWAMISKYGQQYWTGPTYYTGPLDDKALDANSYSPYAAWNNFWNALNGNGLPTGMNRALEMHIVS